MSTCFFGWPVYNDASVLATPSYSRGSWLASLPLTNLSDRRLAQVARSSDATAASTQFDVDLNASRGVALVAIPKHTMTTTGTWRVRGYTGAGHTTNVYDSGTLTPFPSGLNLEDIQGLNVPAVVLPSVSARYWFIELTDTGNPAGYVDVSRLIIAGGFQPTVNILQGSGQGLEDLTTRSETDGGAALFTVRSKRRTVVATLDEMQEAEMFTSFWKMQKQLGISGQLFFMWDSADTTYKHDRAFLAVFKQLEPITMAAWPRYRAPFQLVEEI